MMEGMLEKTPHERGVNGSGNPDGMGLTEPNNTSSRLLSISSMFQLLQSIHFKKIALCFQIL